MKEIRFVILSLFLLILSTLTLNADSEFISFSVKTIDPNNQITENAGYFDLMLLPNESQTLQVQIKNNENKPIRVHVEILDASTGNNATSVYSSELERDSSLSKSMTDILHQKSNTVEIPAHQVVIHNVELDSIDESFKGVIVGGLQFEAELLDTVSSDNTDDEGIHFDNKINQLIGIKIRMSNEEVLRNLNLVGTGIRTHHYKPVFNATIQNDRAFHMGNINIEGVVTNSDNDVFAHVDVENGEILPNSKFDILLTPTTENIEPGEYALDLKIQHRDQTWSWKETIVIEKKEVDKMKDDISILYPSKMNINLLVFVIGSLLTIGLIILLIMKFKRKETSK